MSWQCLRYLFLYLFLPRLSREWSYGFISGRIGLPSLRNYDPMIPYMVLTLETLPSCPELSRVVAVCRVVAENLYIEIHCFAVCSAGTFHWRGQVPAARRARTSAVRDLRRSTVFCFLGFHMGFPYLREVAELIWHDLRFHPWDRRLFSGHTTGLGESTPYSTFMTWWVAPFFERMICKESPLNWWLNTQCDEYVVETP